MSETETPKHVTPWGRGRPSKAAIELRQRELAEGYILPTAEVSDTPKKARMSKKMKDAERDPYVHHVAYTSEDPITDPGTIRTLQKNLAQAEKWFDQGKCGEGVVNTIRRMCDRIVT